MKRFIADHLITMSEGSPTSVAPGIVDVQHGRVAWSGRASTAPLRTGADVHVIEGTLIPGLVNTHCHTPMVLHRGVGPALTKARWLREVMWPRETRLTPDDVYTGMMAGAAEQLLNGVTTSLETYYHPEAIAAGVQEIGSRCLLAAPVTTEKALDRFGSWPAQLGDLIKLRDAHTASENIRVGIGPQDPGIPSHCLRSITELALDNDMLVSMHVAETTTEVATVKSATGMSIVEYLDSIGSLQPRFIAAHGIWLSDSDIDLLAANHVAVAHCPCSNLNHGSGIARVGQMIKAGINVSVATDGPASHPRMDMFEEMRTAARLDRVSAEDSTVLTASKALAMATSGAADAIHWPEIGRLTPGSWADMVAITPAHPEMADEASERIVWSGSPNVVMGVWVGGKAVVENGQLANADIHKLTADANQVANRLGI